ncbi:APC family permease [Metallumcola ferriviriculae]|uniref:APC family permease n=1 Tax=Metallumcola ferriviriculae TaxID=3039180 RepID=A0AAU0URQ4_9FIRM|nr:APC family permease [Desulfitibacteraceae bacterium MK1]
MHENDNQLVRVLSRKDVLVLAFGAMIGWGWVVLAGTWVKTAGSVGAMIAFAIGGLMVALVGLTYSELTAAMPFVGGEHVFTFRGLGANWSFVATWAIILGYVSVVAFEAVALPTVVDYLVPNYQKVFLWNIAGWDVYLTWALVGVAGSLLMTYVNYIGVKMAAFVQLVFTLIIGVVGLLFITGGFVNGSTAHMQPLLFGGAKGIFAVVIMTPFMFVGFDVIPQAAEEIDLPYNMIGKLLILSVILAAAWYILIILGVSRALTASQLAETSLATADSMAAVFGSPFWGKIMVLGGIGGILTSWNAFYVGGSRAIYAMAEAKMLPGFLGKLHPKFKTPTNAILMIGLLSSIAPFFGRKMLVWLVDAGGLSIVLAYLLVSVSFLVLRYKEPEMERPFTVSYGKVVGVGASLLSLMFVLLYLPGMPAALVWPYEWAIAGGWALVGLIFWVRARSSYGKTATRDIMVEKLKLDC